MIATRPNAALLLLRYCCVILAVPVAAFDFSFEDEAPLSINPHDSNDSGAGHSLKVLAVVLLLGLSAMFSGLGLGLMSLDLIGLEIVVAAGEDEHASAEERRDSEAARRIIPLRKKGNLLLTTLLLGNVSVNSLTSILMADLTSGNGVCLFVWYVIKCLDTRLTACM